MAHARRQASSHFPIPPPFQAGSPRESLSAKAARLAAGQLKLAEGEVLSPSSPTDNVIFATYLDHLGELACSSVRSAVATGVELAVLACARRTNRAPQPPRAPILRALPPQPGPLARLPNERP